MKTACRHFQKSRRCTIWMASHRMRSPGAEGDGKFPVAQRRGQDRRGQEAQAEDQGQQQSQYALGILFHGCTLLLRAPLSARRCLPFIIDCPGGERKGFRNIRGKKSPFLGDETGKKHPPIRSIGEWGAYPLIGLSIGLGTSCFLESAVRGEVCRGLGDPWGFPIHETVFAPTCWVPRAHHSEWCFVFGNCL